MLFFAFPVSDKELTLPLLLEIDLPSRVGDCFNDFGTLLLCDKYGNKMSNISEDCRRRPVRMKTEVLKEWLRGEGSGGVLGESHINSEKVQTLTPGQ